MGGGASLLEQSRSCADQAVSATSRRRRRREGDDIQRRADRVQVLVQLGELSAGRHALEGASIAPGNQATLDALTDVGKRPPVPREPLPDDLFERRRPEFQLDHDLFAKNVRVARRGAAAGPSGMTADHLRPLLDSVADTCRFWRFAQDLARVTVPDDVVDVVRLGRLTALQKPKGGVRGIVAGDIIRRFVARTICQQLSPAVQVATAPFQYALGECIAHALQVLTDLNPRTTILSIDGVGAFDLISRGAMLEGLRSVPGGDSALPFVVQFYGNPSSYLWEDDVGDVHEICQGEGGEQGDPMMPMLYSLGHRALLSVQAQLQTHERLLAFLDDIYVVTVPERTLEVHNILRTEFWRHSRIRVNEGKTQIWNRGGFTPSGHEVFLEAARVDDPDAQVWFGDHEAPVESRGIRVLGTPLGTAEYVRAQLQAIGESRQLPLDRIPAVQDLQSAWLLLLFCVASRSTYYLRVHICSTT